MSDRLLLADEIRQLLGGITGERGPSRATIHRWMRQGVRNSAGGRTKLKSLKIGKHRYVRREHLAEFIVEVNGSRLSRRDAEAIAMDTSGMASEASTAASRSAFPRPQLSRVERAERQRKKWGTTNGRKNQGAEVPDV